MINTNYIDKARGYTLLEVLISIAVLGALSTIGFGYFANYRQTAALNSETNKLVANLRKTQGKALSGENLSDWGIRFFNVSGDQAPDYYVIFSGSNYSEAGVSEIFYMSGIIGFADPADGFSKDVVFSRPAGSASSTSVIIHSRGKQDLSKTITINSLGQTNVE